MPVPPLQKPKTPSPLSASPRIPGPDLLTPWTPTPVSLIPPAPLELLLPPQMPIPLSDMPIIPFPALLVPRIASPPPAVFSPKIAGTSFVFESPVRFDISFLLFSFIYSHFMMNPTSWDPRDVLHSKAFVLHLANP